ncbi:MAG: hypothetical protein IKM73_08170 [Acidaminococcaceae bacterium]|nr:hypothetical protein [Acidaminococcaceae bacterium]
MSIRELLGLDQEESKRDPRELMEELRKSVRRQHFGYSPLRRWIEYESYCFLLGISDHRPARELFESLTELYPFHRERLAVPYCDLASVQITMPETDEEFNLQILSADELDFDPLERDYKGVICAEIDSKQYPLIMGNKGYGVDYSIPSESGHMIHVDSSVILIDSNQGAREKLVVFAIPDESGASYKATFAVWKRFYDLLLPLREVEDIYLAIYEYLHYGRHELQTLVDDHSLIEEFAFRLAYVASKLTTKQTFTIDKAALLGSMRGRWNQFHGDRLLVDDVFFRLAGRLGYARCTDRILNGFYEPTDEAAVSFETFPMRCECELLAELAERAGVSFKQIG